jgi:hypothetical protein
MNAHGSHLFQFARSCGFQHERSGADAGFRTQTPSVFLHGWHHPGAGGTALLINGPADHIHILALVPAKASVSDILAKVKANSSGWVHREFPEKRTFAWQTGYSAFSVSHSQKKTVLDYIANQEEHHRKVSFKEELILFLKKHEVQYDERYIFE